MAHIFWVSLFQFPYTSWSSPLLTGSNHTLDVTGHLRAGRMTLLLVLKHDLSSCPTSLSPEFLRLRTCFGMSPTRSKVLNPSSIYFVSFYNVLVSECWSWWDAWRTGASTDYLPTRTACSRVSRHAPMISNRASTPSMKVV